MFRLIKRLLFGAEAVAAPRPLNSRTILFSGVMPLDGEQFWIFRRSGDDDSGIRCRIGRLFDESREIPVFEVHRYRDGGTTDVVTEVGKFRFPSGRMSRQNGEQPTFNGIPITTS